MKYPSNSKLLIAVALILTIAGIGLWCWDAFIEQDGKTDYTSLIIGFSGLFALIYSLKSNPSENETSV